MSCPNIDVIGGKALNGRPSFDPRLGSKNKLLTLPLVIPFLLSKTPVVEIQAVQTRCHTAS